MARCIFFPQEIIGETPVFANARGHCISVPERSMARHRGDRSANSGLVTVGAGPCLVVVVHDMDNDRGCLTHMTENLTDTKTFNLTDEIIEHMIVALDMLNRPASAQIMLFQGQNRYMRYPAYLAASGVFGQCRVEPYLNLGYPNYAYFPARAEVFPVSRGIGDGLAGGAVADREYTIGADVCAGVQDFRTDFSNRWIEFVNA